MNTDEASVRRIVREELRALLERPAPPGLASDPRPDAIDRFVATLEAGEVPAGELHKSFLRWAEEEAPELAGMTATAFGRLAWRCPRLYRRTRCGRRLYDVLPRRQEQTEQRAA